MRRSIMMLLAAGLPFTVSAQDAASEATRAAHADVAKRLPQGDAGDMANATRGKIAEIPGGVILGKDGGTVWDRRPYAFLDAAEAPDTVNPSLWRQARLNAVHGLFEVVPGSIWQVRGYDISVMTIIRGKSGWIVVDPLLSEEAAAAGWKLFADTVESKAGKRPIRAVIFTHSHSDHFGGVGGIVTPERVRAEKIRIIAPHGFSEEATSENVLAGAAMGRRALYMFGSILPPGCTFRGD
ncbi:MAG: MBL fold metallo-hydrolase, partial [Alphaproteobacteria bacterium HGW-Alphaproteobacteria-13]